MNARLLLASGTGVLALAWLGPLPRLAATAFWAHMTMHVMVVALAAPLLALGLARTEHDPVRRWPVLFAPIAASALELVVIWVWHTPQLHRIARAETSALLLEQASFLGVSLLVWLSALGGAPALRAQRTAAGIAALLVTSMHMTLLGVLLALAPRALYLDSMCSAGTVDPLRDQQIGGVLMLVAGGSSYLIGGLWLLAGLLQTREAQARASS